MTYPPEHTTDFDNDEWINGLDRGEDTCDLEDDIYGRWTPRQRAEYDYQIDLENGDY